MSDPFQERLHAAACRAGVSRIADITALDCIGLPVAQAIRPFSRNYVVSQGKGQDRTAARISAVMESLEFFLGELIGIDETASLRRLGDTLGYDAGRLPLLRALDEEEPLLWTACEDLATGREALLPFDMVSLDFTRETHAPFRNTSNGYGGGATSEAAIQHALFELIERHSLSTGEPVRLFIDRGLRDLIGEPMQAAERAGLKMGVYAYEADVQVPVIKVLLHEPSTGVAYVGAAAHTDFMTCARKAVHEAFQSRLMHISGSRDDVSERGYQRLPEAGMRAANPWPSKQRQAIFSDYGSRVSAAISGGDAPAELLCSAGYDKILVKELRCDGIDVPFVVAAVPGLKFTWHHAT